MSNEESARRIRNALRVFDELEEAKQLFVDIHNALEAPSMEAEPPIPQYESLRMPPYPPIKAPRVFMDPRASVQPMIRAPPRYLPPTTGIPPITAPAMPPPAPMSAPFAVSMPAAAAALSQPAPAPAPVAVAVPMSAPTTALPPPSAMSPTMVPTAPVPTPMPMPASVAPPQPTAAPAASVVAPAPSGSKTGGLLSSLGGALASGVKYASEHPELIQEAKTAAEFAATSFEPATESWIILGAPWCPLCKAAYELCCSTSGSGLVHEVDVGAVRHYLPNMLRPEIIGAQTTIPLVLRVRDQVVSRVGGLDDLRKLLNMHA